MASEKTEILPSIVTEYENGEVNSPENKARNRMVAEGYKYQTLGDNEEKLGEDGDFLVCFRDSYQLPVSY